MEEWWKLVVVVAASTPGLATVVRGHSKAYDVEEKLSVMRGMMVVSLGVTPNCGERERVVVVKREKVIVVERETASGVPVISVLLELLCYCTSSWFSWFSYCAIL